MTMTRYLIYVRTSFVKLKHRVNIIAVRDLYIKMKYDKQAVTRIYLNITCPPRRKNITRFL